MKRANNLVNDFTIENVIKAYKTVRKNTLNKINFINLRRANSTKVFN